MIFAWALVVQRRASKAKAEMDRRPVCCVGLMLARQRDDGGDASAPKALCFDHELAHLVALAHWRHTYFMEETRRDERAESIRARARSLGRPSIRPETHFALAQHALAVDYQQ